MSKCSMEGVNLNTVKHVENEGFGVAVFEFEVISTVTPTSNGPWGEQT